MTATKRAIDYTNVKEGGSHNPRHKAPGDYRAKVVKVEDHKSQAGNDQWVFTIKLASDQRATYPYYCGFEENQAWKSRNLLQAAGVTVPKKRVMVDPNKVINREIGITLDDDEYEGKVKSTIVAVFPVSELSGDEPEDLGEDDGTEDEELADEEPPPPPARKSAPAKKAATPAKKAAPRRRAPEPPADDEDTDEDLDLEEL